MNIGEKIRFYRKRNCMTQEMLAREAGVSVQAVSGWEKNKYIPEGKKLSRIANILHISAENLLSEVYISNNKRNELFDETILFRQTDEQLAEYGMDQTRKILVFLKNEKNRKTREIALLQVNDALSMKIKDEVILSSLMMIDAEQNIGRMQGGKEIRYIISLINGLLLNTEEEEKNARYIAIASDEKASIVLIFHMMTMLYNMARFYERKQIIQILSDIEQYGIPLLENLESKRYEKMKFSVRYRMFSMIETMNRIL